MSAFESRYETYLPQQGESHNPINWSVKGWGDTFDKSCELSSNTKAKAISKAQRTKRLQHYLDSIKAICFTVLMGVTTFGFTKTEVIEQGGLWPYNQPQCEETTLELLEEIQF